MHVCVTHTHTRHSQVWSSSKEVLCRRLGAATGARACSAAHSPACAGTQLWCSARSHVSKHNRPPPMPDPPHPPRPPTHTDARLRCCAVAPCARPGRPPSSAPKGAALPGRRSQLGRALQQRGRSRRVPAGGAALCGADLCCAVKCFAVLLCATLCCWRTYGAVLCCAVLCCAVLCCAVLCCAVLCCAVLCGAVLPANVR
jgi:hypothetical protein